jgi:chloramphenicol 3-O phosphotransferase
VTAFGKIVILNGAPRSGKSSIARVIQDTSNGIWMNLGVDLMIAATPRRYRPGIGLRPGEPDHAAAVVVAPLYAAMWDAVAAHSRHGINVVADVGMYDRTIIEDCLRRLEGLPVLFVAVQCPIEEIMKRRAETNDPPRYVVGTPDDPIPAPVQRWQDQVHGHGIPYDVEVDTSMMSPQECSAVIRKLFV